MTLASFRLGKRIDCLLLLHGQDASDDAMFTFGLVMLFPGPALGAFYFFLSSGGYHRSGWPLQEETDDEDGLG